MSWLSFIPTRNISPAHSRAPVPKLIYEQKGECSGRGKKTVLVEGNKVAEINSVGVNLIMLLYELYVCITFFWAELQRNLQRTELKLAIFQEQRNR